MDDCVFRNYVVDMRQDTGQKAGPKLELAELKLGEDVGAWVQAHRQDDRSWRWIADRLADRTGVTVTAERLRQCFADSGAA